MSENIQDLRLKISTRTHAALYAEHVTTGKKIEDIVRNILDPWAENRIHSATVLQNLLRSEGLAGNDREGGGAE